MTGRTYFSTLRNRMSPEAQERARAKSEALGSEMAVAEVRRAMKLSQEELAAMTLRRWSPVDWAMRLAWKRRKGDREP